MPNDQHTTEPLTFSYRQTWGMVAAQAFRGTILLSPFFVLFVGIGLFMEIGSPGAPPGIPPLWFCGILFLLLMAFIWFRTLLEFALYSTNTWSLYVGEKTVTRSSHGLFGNKDWTMRTDRVTVEAFDLELLDAVFCFDSASMQAFHFIALYEDGKRLLFPCADKEQQTERVRVVRQYLARIKKAA